MIESVLVFKKDDKGSNCLCFGIVLDRLRGLNPNDFDRGIVNSANICYFKEEIDFSTGYIEFKKLIPKNDAFIHIDFAKNGDNVYCSLPQRDKIRSWIDKNIEDKKENASLKLKCSKIMSDLRLAD